MERQSRSSFGVPDIKRLVGHRLRNDFAQQQDGSAVMYASLKAGTQKRTLTEDDRAGLESAYRRIVLQTVARD